MYINYEWKCMCEYSYNREAYLQQKQPTTSHLISFVVAVPTKYFLSFSLMALPVFFQKKRTHFLIEEGRCCCCFFGVVVGNRKLFAISLFSWSSPICAYDSHNGTVDMYCMCFCLNLSLSLCMQHDWCSYVEVTVSYMRSAMCCIFTQKAKK